MQAAKHKPVQCMAESDIMPHVELNHCSGPQPPAAWVPHPQCCQPGGEGGAGPKMSSKVAMRIGAGEGGSRAACLGAGGKTSSKVRGGASRAGTGGGAGEAGRVAAGVGAGGGSGRGEKISSKLHRGVTRADLEAWDPVQDAAGSGGAAGSGDISLAAGGGCAAGAGAALPTQVPEAALPGWVEAETVSGSGLQGLRLKPRIDRAAGHGAGAAGTGVAGRRAALPPPDCWVPRPAGLGCSERLLGLAALLPPPHCMPSPKELSRLPLALPAAGCSAALSTWGWCGRTACCPSCSSSSMLLPLLPETCSACSSSAGATVVLPAVHACPAPPPAVPPCSARAVTPTRRACPPPPP